VTGTKEALFELAAELKSDREAAVLNSMNSPRSSSSAFRKLPEPSGTPNRGLVGGRIDG
jgi:hypothetical protein